MKLMEKMRQKKLGNKGFSLVELIIVIAIMAILLGIVGTQVIPYLNRARMQRDMELLSAISTAAVSAYSTHADDFENKQFDTVLFGVEGDGAGQNKAGSDSAELAVYIKEFLSYDSYDAIKNAMASAEGKTIDSITISFYFEDVTGTGGVLEHAKNTVEVHAYYNGTEVLAPGVTSQL